VTYLIGIDPGLSGAIAVLGAAGELEHLADLPVIRDGRLAWINGGTLQALLIDWQCGAGARAIVERVSAHPRQGVTPIRAGRWAVCRVCGESFAPPDDQTGCL